MKLYDEPECVRTSRRANRLVIVVLAALLAIGYRVVTPHDDDAGAAPVAWVAPEQVAVTP